VGVAMGAAGSAVALDSANVALMGDDLSRLPMALALARHAVRIMRQNVVASLLVKGVVVILVPFGLVTLWMAVAADMGMSLLVTLNGLRLLRAHRATPRTAEISAVSATRAMRSDNCSCCGPSVASDTDPGSVIPSVPPLLSGCTLDAALSERGDEFRELFARTLRRVERHDARSARLILDVACEANTRDLLAREQGCCAFFDFTVAVIDEALVVEVRVPADSEAALDFLLALATTSPVRSR
jgi:hypothetical protein